jgi:hypothetical protein
MTIRLRAFGREADLMVILRTMRQVGAWSAGLAIALASAASAAADSSSPCVQTYEHAQELRKAGKLLASRDQLMECANKCPAALAADCTTWLGEVILNLPTVVVELRDAQGRPETGAQLRVDGKPQEQRAPGTALEMDPGMHTFELRPAQGASITRALQLQEKQKNVPMVLQLPAPPAPKALPPAPPASATARPAAAERSKAVPITLGVLGLAAIINGTVFAIIGRSDVSDMRSTCAPHCSDDSIDAARNKLIIADTSFGAGAVLLGVAAYLYWSDRVTVQPTTTGWVAGYRARF